MAKEKFERITPHVNISKIDVDCSAPLPKLTVAIMAQQQSGFFSNGSIQNASIGKNVGLSPLSMGAK